MASALIFGTDNTCTGLFCVPGKRTNMYKVCPLRVCPTLFEGMSNRLLISSLIRDCRVLKC